jgi:hypothetical protein
VVLALALGIGGSIVLLNELFGSVADGMPDVSADCEEAGNCVWEGGLLAIFVLIGGLVQFLWITVPCTIVAVILLVLGLRHLVGAYKKSAESTGKLAADVDLPGLGFLGGGVALLGPALTFLLFLFAPDFVFR